MKRSSAFGTGGYRANRSRSLEFRKSPKVKGRSRHQELPSDFKETSQSGLAHSACLLHPAERLFDQRPLALADLIAGMPRRALINGAAAAAVHILRHMRPNVHFS